jgi:EamA domain-containing membrane protein RarD
MKERSKKQVASYMQNPLVLLAMGCVLVGMAYASFVWATDSGRTLAYALFFTSIYYAVRTCIQAGKQFKRN